MLQDVILGIVCRLHSGISFLLPPLRLLWSGLDCALNLLQEGRAMQQVIRETLNWNCLTQVTLLYRNGFFVTVGLVTVIMAIWHITMTVLQILLQHWSWTTQFFATNQKYEIFIDKLRGFCF